jgi:hypothetical protein
MISSSIIPCVVGFLLGCSFSNFRYSWRNQYENIEIATINTVAVDSSAQIKCSTHNPPQDYRKVLPPKVSIDVAYEHELKDFVSWPSWEQARSRYVNEFFEYASNRKLGSVSNSLLDGAIIDIGGKTELNNTFLFRIGVATDNPVPLYLR